MTFSALIVSGGILLFSTQAFAYRPKIVDIDSESSFQYAAGVYGSTGTIGSKNNTIASRTVNSLTGHLQIGHKSGYIMPFLFADYSWTVQATDSSRVSGTNVSGSGYNAGVGLRFFVDDFYLSGAFVPFGSFDLSSKTVNNLAVSYSDPTVWSISIGYTMGSASLFLIQKFAEYTRSTVGSVTSSLGDDKLSHISTGGGVEWVF